MESTLVRNDCSCPACGARLEFEDRLLVGEVARCSGCDSFLEVAELDPLTLEPYHRIEATEPTRTRT